jgi:hypothetical protein
MLGDALLSLDGFHFTSHTRLAVGDRHRQTLPEGDLLMTLGMSVLVTERLLLPSVSVSMLADGAYLDLGKHSSLATSTT